MTLLDAPARDRLERDGFVVLDALFDEQAVRDAHGVIAELEARAARMERSEGDFVLEAPGGGWRALDGSRPGYQGVLRSVNHADQHVPALGDLWQRVGLRDVVQGLTGSAADLVNVMFWAKPGRVGSEKPWHQDMAFAPEGFHDTYTNSFTVWVAMDRAVRENGCLQFVRGSHAGGVREHVGALDPAAGEEAHLELSQFTDPEVVAAELDTGSAVAFGGYVAHRSAPNTSDRPRRAFSFVWALRHAG